MPESTGVPNTKHHKSRKLNGGAAVVSRHPQINMITGSIAVFVLGQSDTKQREHTGKLSVHSQEGIVLDDAFDDPHF